MAAAKKVIPVERFNVYLVGLDPAVGYEMNKTRPCVVLSPDDLNDSLQTVIVAPFTSRSRQYRYRVDSQFKGMEGQIALDHMRAVDKSRLVKHLGRTGKEMSEEIMLILAEMFAP